MKVTDNDNLSLTITDIRPEEWDAIVLAGIKALVNKAKTDTDYVLVTPDDPLWEPIIEDLEGRHANIELDDEDAIYLAQIGVVEILKEYIRGEDGCP